MIVFADSKFQADQYGKILKLYVYNMKNHI